MLVFWVDVDNTLIDNDRAKEDFDQHLLSDIGPELTKRFWDIYEAVRKEREVVDIPLSLRRLRDEVPLTEMDDLTYRHIESIFYNYPYWKVLYPDALETLHYLRTIGLPVVVSDGDLVFQAHKIVNSNLSEAVEGRVLLFVHKQEHIEEIKQKFPGDHYVSIDDKPDILFDMKNIMKEEITTVFVRQGKYAHATLPDRFTPDITVDHIGDLRHISAEQFDSER
jgi:hypothetical protein